MPSSPASATRTSTLTPALLAGFGLITVILLATSVVGFVNVREIYRNSATVTHTYEVKTALRGLLASAIDAETGQRGFVITGERHYLEPYERGRANVLDDIVIVRRLTADNPDQQRDLDRLSTLTSARLEELAAVIRLYNTDGFPAARAGVLTNLGKLTMDRMREVVASMEQREDVLLLQRNAQVERSYRQTQISGVITTALALVAVLALLTAVRRLGAARRRAEADAQRWNVTLDSIGDAVITTDNEGRVTRLNPVAEDLTGWTMTDAGGRTMDDVFVIVNEESRGTVESPVAKVLRERSIVGMANHTVLLSKDGRETPIDDSAAPIVTADGTMTGVVMVFRDVTERRKAERERSRLIDAERAAKLEAEHASRAKDEFLAMVSHELRTPLNAVVGWSGMLRSGVLAEERRDRAIEAIHSNAKRQSALIDELLDVSRIISGKLQLDRSPVDLQGLVRSAVDLAQSAADAKRVQLHVDAPAIAPFYGDSARLQQVLGNLLSNAVKFTPEGGSVQLRLHQRDEEIEFVVTDTGEGIPDGFLAAIFEPFKQVDGTTARRHGGLGLGLSIVRHLTEAHGGTVRAESRGAGLGATFIVTLPIVPITPDRLASIAGPQAGEASSALEGRLRGTTLLVVDDEDDSRELIVAALEHHGAVALAAASAAAALAILETTPVDALVSDIAMPVADGYSLIRALRARTDLAQSQVPAIALTSLARSEDRQRALNDGFQVHLTKPVDVETLIAQLAVLVRGPSTPL